MADVQSISARFLRELYSYEPDSGVLRRMLATPHHKKVVKQQKDNS